MAKMGHPLFYKELSEMMRQADTNGDDILSFH
ncbi:Probable calcium-binding protein CML16 [Linum perenne]